MPHARSLRRGAATLALATPLLLVLAGAAYAAPAHHPRAHATATCNHTWIDATVRNETPVRMDVQYFGYGLTNAVCDGQGPHTIDARHGDRWKVGDNIFNTTVRVVYRLTNGDELQLRATGEKGNRNNTLSCEWIRVSTAVRPYDCRVNWENGGVTGQAEITLRVFPASNAPARSSAAAARARAAACRFATTLPGTTINDADVPIRDFGGDVGGWCGHLPRSPLAPAEVDHWERGGPRQGIDMWQDYGLPNNDRIEFTATVDAAARTVGCAAVDHSYADRVYGCQAELVQAADTHLDSVRFRVIRIRAAAAR